MSNASEAYSAVIADLRARIAEHQSAIDGLSAAVRVVLQNAPASGQQQGEQEVVTTTPPTAGQFVGLSLRRAILKLLGQDDNAYDTGIISSALQQGGMTTTGQSFTSNVSATLSDMAKRYGEVERVNGVAWRLTGQGRLAAVGLANIPMNTDGPTYLANVSEQQQ